MAGGCNDHEPFTHVLSAGIATDPTRALMCQLRSLLCVAVVAWLVALHRMMHAWAPMIGSMHVEQKAIFMILLNINLKTTLEILSSSFLFDELNLF